jgi:hypothetical protein
LCNGGTDYDRLIGRHSSRVIENKLDAVALQIVAQRVEQLLHSFARRNGATLLRFLLCFAS